MTALVAVAAFDIMIVVPLEETTVVPAGMPVPVMAWPFITALMLDTPVRDVLPEVTSPVIVVVLLAVAAFDITTVVPVAEEMVVPDAMPVPVMVWPLANPLMLDTPVMDALPEVTIPVNVFVVLMVAAADNVIVLAVNDEMVAPDGMPVPAAAVMGCPAMSPVVLDTLEMVLLPEERIPDTMLALPEPVTVVPAGIPVPEMGCPTTYPVMVGDVMVMFWLPAVTLPVKEATKLEAVAGALIVMVLPVLVDEVAVTVVLAGMLVPVIVVPAMTELTLDTVLRMLLPETVTAVAVAVLDAVAFALIVMVVTPTWVMTVLFGMPVPVTGCPTAAKATDDADVRVLLPEVAMALKVALALLVSAVITVPVGIPVPRMFAPTMILVESVPIAMTVGLPDVVPTWRVVVS